MDKPKNGNFVFVAAITANLIAFFSGIAFGWTSPAIPKLNGNVDPSDNPLPLPITPFEESWIAGLLHVGCMFGTLVGGYTADKMGRKRTLLLVTIPMMASFLITAFVNDVRYYFLARLMVGLGVGSVFVVLPNYLSEMAEAHNRGLIGCFMGVALSSGVLFAFTVGPLLTVRNFCLVSLLPLVMFILTFTQIPETPYYLASISDDEAERALRRIRRKSNSEIQKELYTIKRHLEESRKSQGGLRDLIHSATLRRGLSISLGLVVIQQLAGINVVLSYTQSIFDATKSTISPVTSSIIIGAVQFFTTMITSSVVERLGRKMLLFISSSISSLALAALGVYFYLQKNHFDIDSIYWLPIASLIVYVVTFNVGLGPLPWTVMAEIFPPNVKSVASTLTTISCFVMSFLITFFFPTLSALMGMAELFWMLALCSLLGSGFIYLRVPETKGKTLQEIQLILGRSTKVNNSKVFQG